jgi:hypothetical protein|tara:strand:+ start:18427 stop:18600 length:174 start_codon:yes stop_codon:yes gene_type:complete
MFEAIYEFFRFDFIWFVKDLLSVWIWIVSALALLLLLANTRRRAKTPTDPELGKLGS